MIIKDEKNAIALAKKNNQKAFSFLFEKFWDYIYNYQLKISNNPDKSEEITVITFAKAFDKIKTYNSNFEFKTWLITISKNIQLDELRRDSRVKKIKIFKENKNIIKNIADSDLSAEDKLINKQGVSELLIKIKSLKNEYRNIIQLRFFEELTYKEISEKINLPLNTVKVKLLRAKKILANKIIND